MKASLSNFRRRCSGGQKGLETVLHEFPLHTGEADQSKGGGVSRRTFLVDRDYLGNAPVKEHECSNNN